MEVESGRVERHGRPVNRSDARTPVQYGKPDRPTSGSTMRVASSRRLSPGRLNWCPIGRARFYNFHSYFSIDSLILFHDEGLKFCDFL